ncbi:MAG: ABC transporter substrate-binding protein [Myxococcales bacterium]|nr:ABC transporter substrate-binding protein [Myxococcales bacterium]
MNSTGSVRPSPLAIAVATAAILVACGGGESDGSVARSPGEPAANELFLLRSSAHKSLDPVKQFDQASAEIVNNVYDTLLTYHYLKRPYELVPLLLEQMPEQQADGVTYLFTLKRGVRFMDDPCFEGGVGRELVADDVLYSLKRFADANENINSYMLLAGFIEGLDEFHAMTREHGKGVDWAAAEVAGLTRVDDHHFTIRFTGENPLALFPFATSPTAIVPREAVEMYGDELANHPVGTGPFTIREYSRRGKIVLQKNPHYHETYPTEGEPGDAKAGLLADAGARLPLVDRVHLPLIEEPQPAMLRFRKGEIDWIGVDKDNFVKMATRDDAGVFRLKQPYDEQFRMYTTPGLSTEFISFNMNDELVGKNQALRQAIAMALDVELFLKILHNDRGLPLATLVPHPIAGSENDIDFEYYAFDLEAAKRKLAEAGYPGGEGLPVLTMEFRASTKDTRQTFEFIRNELAAIGVRLKGNFQTFSAFIKRIDAGNFQMAGAGWAADFPDGENFYQLLYSENRTPGPNQSSFADAEYDALYLKSRFMKNGPERFALFRRMSEIVKEECPVILRYNRLVFGLYQPWVGNMKRNMMLDRPYKYLRIDSDRGNPGA